MIVVTTVADFLTMSARADAVIIDAAQLAGVLLGVLRDLYDRGCVVAGVNVPITVLQAHVHGRLPTGVDLDTSQSTYRLNWGGRRFYSVIGTSADRLRSSMLSDQLPNPDLLPAIVRRKVVGLAAR